MDKANGLVKQIKIAMVIGLLAVVSGCGGFWGGGYYYGDEVTVSVPGPDLFLFGGDYYRGRDAHYYSHRGAQSRGAAHHEGGRGGRR